MDCPNCKERLRSDTYRENPYLICFYCEGAWVPKESLEAVCVPLPMTNEGGETDRVCPGCEQPLLSSTILGVEVESCPSCWAVWFDRNELETVAPDYKSDTDWGVVSDDLRGLYRFLSWIRYYLGAAKSGISIASRLSGK